MEFYRPPTPAICLLNRQLSVEANEILYSRNTIHFDAPEDIHDCLEAIGSINKAHVQSISIWFEYRTTEQCQCDEVSTSDTASQWAKALFGSGLTSLTKIDISTEYVGASSYTTYYPSMNPAMERVIKHLFQKDQEGTSRHLKLIPGN
jgi:hypothetical protein